MSELTLYSTQGCHLCELAEDMLDKLKTSHGITYQVEEIGDDDTLVERYGLLIPVVLFPDGESLNWPFSTETLQDALARK